MKNLVCLIRADFKISLLLALLTLPPRLSAAPLLLVHPTNQTVAIGFPLVLSCQATGIGVLKFKWDLTRDGYTPRTVTVAEIADPALRIPSTIPATAGSYTVTVTDDIGSVISNPAHVRVFSGRLTNGNYHLEIWNNLLGTAVRLQSTTNWVNWSSHSTFRNVLNANTTFTADRPYRFFRAIPLPYP